MSEANRTLWRSAALADGVYEVLIDGEATIHSLHKGIDLNDLLLVEAQVAALDARFENLTHAIEGQATQAEDSQ